MSPEEKLILSAAEMPALSVGLRGRVLSAAIESKRRRSFSRRVVWAAGFLAAGAGLCSWREPLYVVGNEVAAYVVAPLSSAAADEAYEPAGPLLNVSARYGRGELLLSAAGDDWLLVEAELESRREGVRQLSSSF